MQKVALSRKHNSRTFELVPRDICENPENGYIQAIAGFVLIDRNRNILVYKRANKINENRLIGKLSCVIGGHIEEMPEDPNNIDGAFIFTNARRELDEEFTGLVGKIDSISSQEGKDVKILSFHIPSFTNLSEVEMVHEGYMYYINVHDLHEVMEGIQHNQDEIESYHILNLDEMEQPVFGSKLTIDGQEVELENWTTYTISHLKNTMSFFCHKA